MSHPTVTKVSRRGLTILELSRVTLLLIAHDYRPRCPSFSHMGLTLRAELCTGPALRYTVTERDLTDTTVMSLHVIDCCYCNVISSTHMYILRSIAARVLNVHVTAFTILHFYDPFQPLSWFLLLQLRPIVKVVLH